MFFNSFPIVFCPCCYFHYFFHPVLVPLNSNRASVVALNTFVEHKSAAIKFLNLMVCLVKALPPAPPPRSLTKQRLFLTYVVIFNINCRNYECPTALFSLTIVSNGIYGMDGVGKEISDVIK